MTDISIKLEVIDDASAKLVADDGDVALLRLGNSVVRINDYDDYEGPYIIVPEAYHSITLPTTDKHTIDDITVQKIPYFETTNTSGGYTVSIAS